MNILNTLTKRTLKLNRKRTIATIIGIILSTAMICATITIAASFQDLFVQSAKLTDGNFHATFYSVKLSRSSISPITPIPKCPCSAGTRFARFEQSIREYRPYFYVKEYDAIALRHMPIKPDRRALPGKGRRGAHL